jgi:cytosine deaminase
MTIEDGEYEGSGYLALPGLVDAHVHLDKCYLLDRCCAVHGDFNEAINETLTAKHKFTKEDVLKRMYCTVYSLTAC